MCWSSGEPRDARTKKSRRRSEKKLVACDWPKADLIRGMKCKLNRSRRENVEKRREWIAPVAAASFLVLPLPPSCCFRSLSCSRHADISHVNSQQIETKTGSIGMQFTPAEGTLQRQKGG